MGVIGSESPPKAEMGIEKWRSWSRPKSFERDDVGAQARQQQCEDIGVGQDFAWNTTISPVDFGDEGFVRQISDWHGWIR